MANERKTYLKTENFTVGYRRVPLISNIEIAVHTGEILALIGPNGAGKTTILKSIIRQLEPIGGVVYLSEKNMKEMKGSELAKEMAVMLTQRVNTELLTVYDVVSAGRYPHTGTLGLLSDKDHAKIREAMKLVQVTELADRDFGQISDGQRQRVLLARALCQEPKLLILDEPTSFLDVRYKLEFFNILRGLAQSTGLSVVLSLHELDLAQRVADRVVCVKGDRILANGTPEEVFLPGFVEKLYDFNFGSYLPMSGSVEMEAITGTPKIFVLAGNGTGTPIYRKLQRDGIPFTTGILWENDMDYPAAKALAVEVLSIPPFGSLGEADLQKARDCIDTADTVIATLGKEEMQGAATPLRELLAYAGEKLQVCGYKQA